MLAWDQLGQASGATAASFNPDVEIVVARFREDVTWLKDAPYNRYRQTIYSKVPSVNPCAEQTVCNVRYLENIGRESHTYLSHIIDNYDNLADVTVFLPGSATDKLKIDKTLNAMAHIHDYPGTVFPSDSYGEGVSVKFNDFSIAEWQSTNDANRAVNRESTLDTCAERPFGNWYKKNFPDLPRITPVAWNGIFAVARDHIHNHPKEYYQNLLPYLTTSSNPECGHYFERAWGAIFYPYPEQCIYQIASSSAQSSVGIWAIFALTVGFYLF